MGIFERFRQWKPLILGLTIVVIAVMKYQSWQLNQKVETLVSERRYEEAISLLRDKSSPYFRTEASQHLAWLLTTNPKLSTRNYPEAIELSTKIVEFTLSKKIKQEAIDTLVCAHFGNREEKLAIELAQKNGLKNRVEQFTIGRPCSEEAVSEIGSRTIAHESKDASK